MSHIFISYSKKNRNYARKLAKKLQQEGFNIWIDDRIDYGVNWENTIFRAIDECDAFVPIMSLEASDSTWVQRECHHADKRGKPTFPVLLSGEEFPRYGLTQYADVNRGRMPEDDFYTRIAGYVPRNPRVGENVTSHKSIDRYDQSTPPLKQKSALNSRLLIIIAVLLIVISGGVGFIALNSIADDNPNTQTTVDNNDSISPIDMPEVDNAGLDDLPEFLRTPIEQANFHREQGESTVAIDLLSTAIGDYPDEELLYLERGINYIVNGQPEYAVEDFDQALELTGDWAEAYFWYGIAHANLGDYTTAIADINTAIELDYEVPEYHLELGHVYYTSEDTTHALLAYQTYAELAGDDANAEILDRIRELGG